MVLRESMSRSSEIAEVRVEFYSKHCLGIIGTGNRNFAGIYIFTAKELSAKYQIPLLYDFEFNGTPADVAAVEKLATQLDKGAKVTFKNPL